jgi:hypothetical protein
VVKNICTCSLNECVLNVSIQTTKVRLSGDKVEHTGCNRTYRCAKMLGVGEGEIVQTLTRIEMLSRFHAQSITPETNRSLVKYEFFCLHIPVPY